MAKMKLQRFAEVDTFKNVYPISYEQSKQGFGMKGQWNEKYFNNNYPIILELGCGKGEYTVGLAEKFPEKNFIGIDIKGNRIWRGAKTAIDKQMNNVAFLRTRIDFIESCFASNETSEIWITFPDPYPKKKDEKKRLTSPEFIERYRNVLNSNGLIHLKTDHLSLYEYTHTLIVENNYKLLRHTNDLYGNDAWEEVNARSIQTFYEKKFVEKGNKICYLQFAL